MSQTTSATAQITCGFCKGLGKDPFGLVSGHAACQVCCGTGKVEVIEPVIECAFCRGTGVYHNTRITCTVCNGKGMVTAPQSPTERCTKCEGTGTTMDSAMPCLKCKGKGVVSK
jgi:DnaJ-class molecular chaperone